MAKGRCFPLKLFDEGDAEHDAEDAVEGPGVGDGVEVRADEEARRVWCGAGQEPAHIADSVDVHGHAGGLHPAPQKRMDLVHGRSEEECA